MRILISISIVVISFFFTSCEKQTLLLVNQTSLSFENNEGSQSINVVANKAWEVSSDALWCIVSPSSGDGSDNGCFTLFVSCEANTSLDERSCTITIICEELVKEIVVTQAERKGLIVSPSEYSLSNEAQTLSIMVQANVQYTVSIDDACKSWIRQESTKAPSSIVMFDISKNETYDNRRGTISFMQVGSPLKETISINQSQTDVLFAEKHEYQVSFEEQQISIRVASNIEFEILVAEGGEDWLRCIQTKGLADHTVTLQAAENESGERCGEIILKGATIQDTVIVRQGSGLIEIEDDSFKAYCVENYDKNGDRQISIKEANAITFIDVDTYNIESLRGIEFMPNLTELLCCGKGKNGKLTNLDVSKNPLLKTLCCDSNSLTSLNVSNNSDLTELSCSHNPITVLDISLNTALITLRCQGNLLSKLDLRNNAALQSLSCDDNRLTVLDVSKNAALQLLSCDDNQLSILDTRFNSELKSLSCDRNLITSLFVYKNTALLSLSCCDNRLTTLEVRYNMALKSLSIDGNILRSIVLKDNTHLESFSCSSNQFSYLDLNNNTRLESVFCDRNMIEYLHVEKCVNLQLLYCYSNLLKTLDVSNNTELTSLHCESNPYLTEIWLNVNQTIPSFVYDTNIASIKYKGN